MRRKPQQQKACTVVKTAKCRIFPNPQQYQDLEALLRHLCWLHNYYLEDIREAYRGGVPKNQSAFGVEEVTLSQGDLQKDLTNRRAANPRIGKYPRAPQISVISRLITSRDRCIKGLGRHPKKKSVRRMNSFDCAAIVFAIKDGTINIPGIGRMPIKFPRKFRGKQGNITIKRIGNMFFAFIPVHTAPKCYEKGEKFLGAIDVGVMSDNFAVDPLGNKYFNSRPLREAQAKLRRYQRKLSRCMKPNKSNSWHKSRGYRCALKKVQKCHHMVKQRRRQMHINACKGLMKDYLHLAVEKLQIKNMAKNSKLAKSIYDAGWSEFLSHLHRKYAEAGRKVVFVNPQGTSQECSRCGKPVHKTLKDRVHSCPHCNLVLNRDRNAAVNIFTLGLDVLARTLEKDSVRIRRVRRSLLAAKLGKTLTHVRAPVLSSGICTDTCSPNPHSRKSALAEFFV